MSRRMRESVECMFCLSDGQDNAEGPMFPGDRFAVHNRGLLASALREASQFTPLATEGEGAG
jgi:hypothetical protein